MFYDSIFMEANMLNIKEIKNTETSDQAVKDWLFKNPGLADKEVVIELLEKYRPEFLKNLLKELLKKYVEIVTIKK